MSDNVATELKFIKEILLQHSEQFVLIRKEMGEMREDLRDEIHGVYTKLDSKIDNLADFVFEALDIHHQDHEQRICLLEESAGF